MFLHFKGVKCYNDKSISQAVRVWPCSSLPPRDTGLGTSSERPAGEICSRSPPSTSWSSSSCRRATSRSTCPCGLSCRSTGSPLPPGPGRRSSWFPPCDTCSPHSPLPPSSFSCGRPSPSWTAAASPWWETSGRCETCPSISGSSPAAHFLHALRSVESQLASRWWTCWGDSLDRNIFDLVQNCSDKS